MGSIISRSGIVNVHEHCVQRVPLKVYNEPPNVIWSSCDVKSNPPRKGFKDACYSH